MHKILVTGLAASIGIGFAVAHAAAHAGLFSAKGPVIAILGEELYVGEAEGHLDGSGTIAIHSQINLGITCQGQFTSSAKLGGAGQMQCSDGASATYHFQRLTVLRGHGAGSYSRGSMSFTYGLTADEAGPYLTLPAGKKLENSGKLLALVDISLPLAVAPAKATVARAPAVAPKVPPSKSSLGKKPEQNEKMLQADTPPRQDVVVARDGAVAPAVVPNALPTSPFGKKPEQNEKKLESADIPPAEDVAPDVLLNAVTSEVIAILKRNQALQTGNPANVAELVETRILPHFDFARMTRIAVARNWRLASPGQQTALTAEFKTLLVRTYSTALSSYRDQVIEYKPLRAAPGDTEVTVKSEIKQPGTERMTIDYNMEKTPAGWKVYDIKVAGVSLVTTYRDTFAGKVRDGGVDGLIKSLADKNRQGDSRFKSP